MFGVLQGADDTMVKHSGQYASKILLFSMSIKFSSGTYAPKPGFCKVCCCSSSLWHRENGSSRTILLHTPHF